MYSKPQIQKFGTFRELTRVGWKQASDGLSILGIGGCNVSEYFGYDCPTDTDRGPTSS